MKIFNKYKFSNKSQTLGGTISVLLGAASVASFAYGVYISFLAGGEAGLETGSMGMLALMLAGIGCIIGFLSFREENKFYTLSRVGSLLCGIMTIMMLSVFVIGLI